MNKGEFVDYIAKECKITKSAADRIINIFVASVIGALGAGNEVLLTGFGRFAAKSVAARDGRNPSTGKALKIEAYVRPSFTAGSSLKAACRQKDKDNNEVKKEEVRHEA
jgi:DNA-binding protein HU-beta